MIHDYNLTGKVSLALERAIYVSEDFLSDELCTFHLGLSLLMDEECCIQLQYKGEGYMVDVPGMLYMTLNSDEQFTKITGKEFPKKEEQNLPDEKKDGEVSKIDTTEVAENNEESSKVIYVIANQNYNYSDLVSYENIKYSENLEKVFEDAYKRCISNGISVIDEENLLYSLLGLEDSSFVKLLKLYEFDIEEMKNILSMNSNIFEVREDKSIKIPKVLESCCDVLNANYTKGEKCPILGRDTEIASMWNIFSKKTKRNVMIVGEPGVGKTAVTEAVTMQIVNEECPKEFIGYIVISLNLTGMVAGTKYRGEFEVKVQQLIKFLKNTSNVIIFIDEIHQIFGTGASEGSGPDFSGSLKPILARDDVVFIGSTTMYEYEKYFSNDPAFKRRFEVVEIKEPKLKDVKKMVSLKVETLSSYHNIKIDDDCLDYIIITAKAMNNSGKNPDITIDLVDRAMAIAKNSNRKVLSRKDVDKVYKQNYDMFKKIPKKEKMSTAYHEAGHTLMNLLSKNNKTNDVKIVSIVPTSEYMGVTIHEQNDKFSHVTLKAVREEAGADLAGRIAQEFVSDEWDFGASADLVNATSIVRRMIVEMGMDKSIYTNISLYDYNSKGHTMSPEAIDRVNDRIKEVIDEVYQETKNTLIKHRDKLDVIANLLMKKGIISIEEIMQAFKEKCIRI